MPQRVTILFLSSFEMIVTLLYGKVKRFFLCIPILTEKFLLNFQDKTPGAAFHRARSLPFYS